MTLLLGVRDNDLKGINPLSSLDLIQVHGSPTTQQEHCIRSSSDDNADGNRSALAACQACASDRGARQNAPGSVREVDDADPVVRQWDTAVAVGEVERLAVGGQSKALDT